MMEGFWITIIAIIGFFVIFFTVVSKKIDSKQKQFKEYINNIADFKPHQYWFFESNGIALDEKRMLICLVDCSIKQLAHRLIPHKDLLSSEITSNNLTITKTNRTSQIGGALIGGLALGGAGAIIGGLSGSTETTNSHEDIRLRLIINDLKNPIFSVKFMIFMEKAQKWHGLMNVMINQADMEDKKSGNIQSNKSISNSLGDEIKKLVELRDSGAITDDEFTKMKTNLINSSNSKN